MVDIPSILDKSKKRNTQTKDLCIQFSGKEDKLERLIENIKQTAEQEIGKKPDQIGIKSIEEKKLSDKER